MTFGSNDTRSPVPRAIESRQARGDHLWRALRGNMFRLRRAGASPLRVNHPGVRAC